LWYHKIITWFKGANGTQGQQAANLSVALDVRGETEDSIDIFVEEKQGKMYVSA
jgi:hypothetical protein